MRRVFPYPLLSMSLAIMWLLLTGTYEPRSYVFAALLGIILPFMLMALTPEKPRIRNVSAIVRLGGIVLYDIVRSNIAVTKIIFGGYKRERVSDFIHVPLEMTNRYGLAVLAIIVTSTPGTLWVQYDQSRNILVLHVLDLVDESEWVALIKGRYERLLMEVFE